MHHVFQITTPKDKVEVGMKSNKPLGLECYLVLRREVSLHSLLHMSPLPAGLGPLTIHELRIQVLFRGTLLL